MERNDFERYARKYKDMAYRVALNFTCNPEDAEDAVQEVLMRLFTAKGEFQGEEHVKRWMIRVTLNYCRNLAREARHRAPTPPEELALSVPFEAEEQLELFTAVMALPEKYRVPLYLFYYEEYSVREIAGIMHLTESNVTTRLSRARAMLKSKLVEERV